MSKKNVTFADIAEYTGFSKTTISRYFSNPDSVTLENQDKIAHALETLNYKENKLARVMANGKTEIIGVIIPNLYMHYYSDVLTISFPHMKNTVINLLYSREKMMPMSKESISASCLRTKQRD